MKLNRGGGFLILCSLLLSAAWGADASVLDSAPGDFSFSAPVPTGRDEWPPLDAIHSDFERDLYALEGSLGGAPFLRATSKRKNWPVSEIKITRQPRAQDVQPGEQVQFSVLEDGAPPIRYQWRLNGMNIPGATNASFTLTDVRPIDGGSYQVSIANRSGAIDSQVAALTVQAASLFLSDTLSKRPILTSFAGAGRGNNAGANRERNEPDHAGKSGGKSVWGGWVAPAAGTARFSTRGSGFDTLLAVYTNAAKYPNTAGLRRVASDDDAAGFGTSEVSFNAAKGTEYLIAIDGFAGAAGIIVFSWQLATNQAELPQIVRQPAGQTAAAGEDVTFQVSASAARALQYQWLFNGAPILDATNSALTLAGVRTNQIGVYSVQVRAGGRAVESSAAALQLNSSGEYEATQKVQARDKFAYGTARAKTDPGFNNTMARGVVGTQTFHTFGCAKELGEPNHAGEPGGASAWFTIVAAEDGAMIVSTEGSDFDTVMAVYSGPSEVRNFRQLTLEASDHNSGSDGKSSWLTFPAVGKRAYHVAIDGVNGATGRVRLHYHLAFAKVILFAPLAQTEPSAGTSKLSAELMELETEPLHFQWKLNGEEIPGATNATFSVTNAAGASLSQYSVVIDNYDAAGLSRAQGPAPSTVMSYMPYSSFEALASGFHPKKFADPFVSPALFSASAGGAIIPEPAPLALAWLGFVLLLSTKRARRIVSFPAPLPPHEKRSANQA